MRVFTQINVDGGLVSVRPVTRPVTTCVTPVTGRRMVAQTGVIREFRECTRIERP